MKIYVDQHGFTHVQAAPSEEIVGDFLTGDIQGSVYGVDEYINACLAVERGGVERWEATGNAHTVTIENKSVEIFNEYTEQSLRISISRFRTYLDEWKRYLLEKK